jgi:hypothetical protein
VAAEQTEERLSVSGAAQHQRDAQDERRHDNTSVHRETPEKTWEGKHTIRLGCAPP